MDARELIDWDRLARIIGIAAGAWFAFAALGIATTMALVGERTQVPVIGTWVALAVVGSLITAVGIVAYSALVAMRRAGDRGDRLAAGDVGLLPPRRRGARDDE